MNRDLATLREWAAGRALDDDDLAARPLWSQIAAEVGDYLDGPTEPPTGPHLFEETNDG